jgi:hypothetical protein
MHSLRCVDHPDPQAESYFSGNNPLFPDTRNSTTYSAPKGPRHFKPSPLKK